MDTMSEPNDISILPLAEFKPSPSSRPWVSIPNPNGLPLIATATSDKTVRVYSLKNFTLHSKLEGGHERSVRSVAWKPSAKTTDTMVIATGSFDSTMAIWRRTENIPAEVDFPVQTHTKQAQAETNVRDENDIDIEIEVEISGAGKPKPKTISKGDNEDEDEDNEDWEFAVVLDGHDAEIKTVAYSPSGQWLASCSRDKTIWIWEEIGGDGDDEFETVAVLQDHTQDVKYVCWRKDDGNGEVLASASYDDTIRFWRGDDEGEWSSIAELSGHEGTVWCLDWEPEVSQKIFTSKGESSENGYKAPPIPRLISSSADCTIRVWSIAPSPPPPNRPSYFNPGIPSTMRPGPTEETWKCTAILPNVHDLPIYSVNWSKLSGRVVSTGGDGKIAIYEERTKGRTVVGGKIETEWVILAVIEGSHGPYEVNHATWCTRFDAGKREDRREEMLVTTGDDGVVRAWFVGSATDFEARNRGNEEKTSDVSNGMNEISIS